MYKIKAVPTYVLQPYVRVHLCRMLETWRRLDWLWRFRFGFVCCKLYVLDFVFAPRNGPKEGGRDFFRHPEFMHGDSRAVGFRRERDQEMKV